MQSPLVSVIIPVYNVKKYLKKCIESVILQTYENIEIILVNDGSTDGSGVICDEYAVNDMRIRVIHQDNFGVSYARNIGINIATGDYIQFVDSDDCLESIMIKKLVEVIDGSQMVICGYKSTYGNRSHPINKNNTCPIEGEFKKNDFLNSFGILFKHGFINSPCNKLYLTDIIQKYGIRFNEDLSMGEDLIFNLEYINACERISIIQESLYNYISFNSDSLTRSFNKELFDNQKMLFSRIKEFLLSNNYYTNKNRDLIQSVYTDAIIGCFEQLFHPKGDHTIKTRQEYIRKVVFDSSVRDSIVYFKHESSKKRLIGFMIKYKLILAIGFYFKFKSILRLKIKPLFILINNKQH